MIVAQSRVISDMVVDTLLSPDRIFIVNTDDALFFFLFMFSLVAQSVIISNMVISVCSGYDSGARSAVLLCSF